MASVNIGDVYKQEVLEKLPVVKLKQLAKEYHVKGYSTMRKAELVKHLDALLARQEARDPLEKALSDCVTEKRVDVLAKAKALGIAVRNKTKEQLCREIEEVRGRPPPSPTRAAERDCESLRRADVVQLADAYQIAPKRKSRKQLCAEIEEAKKRGVVCTDIPRIDVVNTARDMNIPTRGKPTAQICNEIAVQVVSTGSPTMVAPPVPAKPFPQTVAGCQRELKDLIVQEAMRLGISVKGKTKLQLCTEIGRVAVRIPKTCMEKSLKAVREWAMKLDIDVKGKTKVQLCNAIEAIKREIYETLIAAEAAVEAEALAAGEIVAEVSPASEESEVEESEVGVEVVPAPVVNPALIDIIEELTGKRRYLTPAELERVVQPGRVEEFARRIGIATPANRRIIEIIREIYRTVEPPSVRTHIPLSPVVTVVPQPVLPLSRQLAPVTEVVEPVLEVVEQPEPEEIVPEAEMIERIKRKLRKRKRRKRLSPIAEESEEEEETAGAEEWFTPPRVAPPPLPPPRRPRRHDIVPLPAGMKLYKDDVDKIESMLENLRVHAGSLTTLQIIQRDVFYCLGII